MTVHFIGAGPGAPDLITLRGRDLIARCPVCLYAGSLVPEALLAHCPPGARIVNTAPLDLDAIVAEIAAAHAAGRDVARLHSGDVSVWSAMGEQIRRLRALGIPCEVTPGVPAFAAAAAALGAELTMPGVVQSVVLTRTPGRASAMPEAETLARFAATGAVLAVHLSVHRLAEVAADLSPHYGPDCPAAVVWRASWPEERVLRGTLATLAEAAAAMEGHGMERTGLILVGPSLAPELGAMRAGTPAAASAATGGAQAGFGESRLYAPDYDRRFRPQGAVAPAAERGRDLAAERHPDGDAQAAPEGAGRRDSSRDGGHDGGRDGGGDGVRDSGHDSSHDRDGDGGHEAAGDGSRHGGRDSCHDGDRDANRDGGHKAATEKESGEKGSGGPSPAARGRPGEAP